MRLKKLKIIKKHILKILLCYYLISTFLGAIFIGWHILILLTTFYTITFLIIKKNSFENSKLTIIISVSYPIFILTGKLFLPQTVFFNRLEHASFSVVLTYLITKITSSLLKPRSFISFTVFNLALLNLFGVSVEILEFFMRQNYIIDYYQDTLYDLITNLIASILTLLLIHCLKK